MLRIGVDLGGTKIEVAVIDDNGEFIFRKRLPTPQGQYQQTLQTICQLVAEAESITDRQTPVGVAAPGAISRGSGLLKNSNSVCLNGKPILTDLQQMLARPVRIANDADCLALSEAMDGAAQQATTVFAAILGTGVGGGIVVNRQLLSGPNAIAGEWGHNSLPWPQADELPGPQCYCGRHGCVETWVSGPGMSNDHQRITGRSASGIELTECALANEPEAMDTLLRYEDRLARALALVINILDPDIIVLGGGLSNIERLYTSIPALLPKYVFSDTVYTRIVKAKYGDSSGVRGAAWLWPD